jgi:hypothetical protein
MSGSSKIEVLSSTRTTEVANVPLHDGLVFFWGSLLAIVGDEFGDIRTGDDHRKAAVRGRTSLGPADWNQNNRS